MVTCLITPKVSKREGDFSVSNATRMIVYAPFVIANTLFIVNLVCQPNKTALTNRALELFLFIFGWQFCEVLFYSMGNNSMLQYAHDLKTAFIGFVGVSLFRLISYFWGLDQYIPKWCVAVMHIVPAITALLCLTTMWHPYITEHFELIVYYPLVQVFVKWGLWYMIHLIYAELLAFVIMVIAVYSLIILPKAYKNGAMVMTFGTILFLLGNVFETFHLIRLPADGSLLGANFAGIAMYIALSLRLSGSNLKIGREEVFNYIGECIFILDAQGYLFSANKEATAWLNQFQWSSTLLKLQDKFDYLIETRQIHCRGLETKQEPPAEHGENEDIYIDHENYSLAYEKTTQFVRDERGQIMGQYIVLTDVTRNRVMIERLRQTAGVDSLTGIANRYAYQEFLRKKDHSKDLPLGLLIGDINDLKIMNDRYGHHMGDIAIKTITKALGAAAPPGAMVARIGGDEFAMVVPQCTSAQMDEIMRQIDAWIVQNSFLPETLQMAMGYAIKYTGNENIFALIDAADKKMYGQK